VTDPTETTANDIIAAVDADSEGRLADVTLPDEALTIDATEAAELAAGFRRVRDAHRGRYAASLRELPGEPARIATALAMSAEKATPEERRHLLEDLFDLQAFVEDDAAGALPVAAVAPAAPDSDANRLLERIRWRQATLTAALMGHPSVLGDHNAIRDRWTTIGDARAAINLVNDYREKQTAGIGALSVYIVAAPIGLGLAWLTGLGRPSLVGIAGLVAGWFVAPFVGAAAGSIEAWIMRQPWRGSRIASAIEVVAGVGALIVVPVVWGFVVGVLGLRLGLP